MPPEEREERLALRLSASELAMVNALADDVGVTLSDAVRMAIREAYRSKFGEKKPKASKPKK